VVARELTKLHEEFVRGSATEVKAIFDARPVVKGEITILIGRGRPRTSDKNPMELVRELESAGFARMDAIKMAAKQLDLPKREVYRLVSEAADSN
jgi:16S rRNA (cytidine1402-2'-O)-methyltransferase